MSVDWTIIIMEKIKAVLVVVLNLCLCGIIRAQTITDIGVNAPDPGPNDISQMSVAGYNASPDGLNYYINNDPVCGQTFTTGNSPDGYQLNSLSIRTAGNGGGGIATTHQSWKLWIYHVSGSNATMIAAYTSQSDFVFAEGDWLQWCGLSLSLSPNTTYAYAIRDSVTSSWESLYNASGNRYTGGEMAMIPPSGGQVTFGGGHEFDATFEVGLSILPPANGAGWETLVDGTSFNSMSAFKNKWSYNYPWGMDHNGSARMNETNVTVSGGVVTLTSSPAKRHEGNSSASPHLRIRYNSGTFYLNQQITISKQYPVWDISGQFKVPTEKGTWPAFWMTGANSWPPESDFMEFKGSTGCNQNTYNGSWQGKTTTISTASVDWHTYRIVATLKDSTNVDLRYYIDGILETEHPATTFVDSPCWLIVDYQMEGSSGAPGPNYNTCCYVTNIVVKRKNASGNTDGPIANGSAFR
jgi:hypothetical protein